MNILDIICMQTKDGAWHNFDCIGKLFGKYVQESIIKEPFPIPVITLLVLKWIEKFYPEKCYNIIVIKGQNYLKRNQVETQTILKRYANCVDI